MVNSGRKAATIIAEEKKMGRLTSCAANCTARLFICPVCVCEEPSSARWRQMFSTMTTEASTIMPKSIAPMEMRFADSPRSTIMMKVNRSERGMVSATTREARQSPRKASRIKATRTIPSTRVRVGMRGDLDQISAVIVRDDTHALGEYPVVELLDLLPHALKGRQRLLSTPHQHDALDNIVLLIFPHASHGHFSANADLAELLEVHGRPVLGGAWHGDIGNVVRIRKEANATHVIAL